jgi:hypothetical protein
MMRSRIKTALLLGLSLGLLAASATATILRFAEEPSTGKAPGAEPPAKARAFKSTLPLAVYQIVDGEPLRLLGQTGPGAAAKGVNIPAGANWAVQPLATAGVGFGGGFGGQLGAFGNVGGGGLVGGANLGGGAALGAFGVPPGGKLPKGKAPPAPVFGAKLDGAGLKSLVTEIKKQSIPGLILDFPPISAEDFAQVANISGLRSLIVRGSAGFTQEHLNKLEGLKGLRLLALENVPVKPDGLKALARLPALNELHLAGEGLTSKEMEGLKELKRLTALRWQHGAGADGLEFLKSLPGLKQLELVGGFTDTDLKALKDLKGLEVVRLFQTATTDDVMDLLKPHQGLRVLALDGHRSPVGSGMQPVAFVNGGKLQWMMNGHAVGGFGGGFGGFGGAMIGGGAGALGVAGMPGAGAAPQFTSKSLEKLADFPKLTEVSVYNSKLKDPDILPLAKLTGLRKLALFAPEVGDTGVLKLKALTRLESLDLRGTEMTVASAAAMKPMAALKTLRVNLVAEDAASKKKLAAWRTALPRVNVLPIPTAQGVALPGGGIGGGGFGGGMLGGGGGGFVGKP